jgi:5'-nucleotidase
MREGGVIRYEDLFTAQPFDNQLVTMSLSGTELIALLQRQWRDDRPCNLLHVSEGLGYRFNPNLARPDRLVVDSVRLHGQPIDPQRDYRITVNSFMAEGGDGFVEFTKGRDRRVGPRDIDALEAYVTQLRVVQPPPLNRVVPVN